MKVIGLISHAGFLLLALFLSLSTLQAGSPPELFDTQTALTPGRGEFFFKFTAYDAGGLNAKAGLGVTQFLSLGIAGFADGIIGSNAGRVEIPGVFAKINVTDQPAESINLAFGYDSFYHGSFSEEEHRPYALYVAATKGFFLLAKTPHLVTLGFGYPVIPQLGKPTFFASLLVSIVPMLHYATEFTDVTFNKDARFDVINNHILSLQLVEGLSFQFIFQLAGNFDYDVEKQSSKLTVQNSRNFRVCYQTFF